MRRREFTSHIANEPEYQRRIKTMGTRTKCKNSNFLIEIFTRANPKQYQWRTEWGKGKTAGAPRELQPTLSKKKLRIHNGIDRSMSSLITQNWTGKIGLGAFLYAYKVPGYITQLCGCGRGARTRLVMC